ncbi:MAG TPA: fibronectin type III domain-containing protein, partial [Planctomycetota bacterium]|nr:fibronectin type III domain-containing protein [Planctomycetota bacterium]
MRKLLHRFLVAAVAAALIPACGGGGSGSDSPPLSAPPGLFRATWGNAEVTLTWLTSSGAGSYNVYRATSCDGPYTLVVNVTGTTYTDSVGLSNGTTYYYTVRSVSGGAESAPAIPQSGIPNPVPPAPASVNATAGERKVDLTWSPVGGATGYAIDRASAPGGAYRRVDTVGSSATTYSSTGLSAGVPYYFVVRALNGSVVGPPSSEVTATPTPPPAPPPFPAFNQARGFNGVMDPLWSPIYTLAKAADGSGDIYVGGGMSTYGSSAVPVLVRLNADGTMDSGFSVSFSASGTVHVITPATDGSGDVYVGGWFSTVNGAPA